MERNDWLFGLARRDGCSMDRTSRDVLNADRHVLDGGRDGCSMDRTSRAELLLVHANALDESRWMLDGSDVERCAERRSSRARRRSRWMLDGSDVESRSGHYVTINDGDVAMDARWIGRREQSSCLSTRTLSMSRDGCSMDRTSREGAAAHRWPVRGASRWMLDGSDVESDARTTRTTSSRSSRWMLDGSDVER